MIAAIIIALFLIIGVGVMHLITHKKNVNTIDLSGCTKVYPGSSTPETPEHDGNTDIEDAEDLEEDIPEDME